MLMFYDFAHMATEPITQGDQQAWKNASRFARSLSLNA
jgi:hypothetical protein